MCYKIRPLTMFDTEHTHDIRVINHIEMKFVCKHNQIHIYTYGYFVFIV